MMFDSPDLIGGLKAGRPALQLLGRFSLRAPFRVFKLVSRLLPAVAMLALDFLLR